MNNNRFSSLSEQKILERKEHTKPSEENERLHAQNKLLSQQLEQVKKEFESFISKRRSSRNSSDFAPNKVIEEKNSKIEKLLTENETLTALIEGLNHQIKEANSTLEQQKQLLQERDNLKQRLEHTEQIVLQLDKQLQQQGYLISQTLQSQAQEDIEKSLIRQDSSKTISQLTDHNTRLNKLLEQRFEQLESLTKLMNLKNKSHQEDIQKLESQLKEQKTLSHEVITLKLELNALKEQKQIFGNRTKIITNLQKSLEDAIEQSKSKDLLITQQAAQIIDLQKHHQNNNQQLTSAQNLIQQYSIQFDQQNQLISKLQSAKRGQSPQTKIQSPQVRIPLQQNPQDSPFKRQNLQALYFDDSPRFQSQNCIKFRQPQKHQWISERIEMLFAMQLEYTLNYQIFMNQYTELKQALRQAKAQKLLQTLMTEDIEKGLMENKFACICLKGDKLDVAEKHLHEARKKLSQLNVPITNISMNLGNLYAQRKEHEKAIEQYRETITQSPYYDEQNHRGVVWNSKLNSFDAFVDAHTNLACLLTNLDRHVEAYEYCLKAIELQPNNYQAQTNFGDLLRQLGRREDALNHTWSQIEKCINGYTRPQPIVIQNICKEAPVNVICLKWGTKYDHNYVNRLYSSIKRHTQMKFTFICVTDDTSNLNPEIETRELCKGWTGWWGKATLFSDQYNFPPGKLVFIDLDMVITGSMDDIFNYQGMFGILGTDQIACEKLNKGGYNSSIMIWNHDIFGRVFSELEQHWDTISRYIVRFDFWLEMMIHNADELQKLFPGQIQDYVLNCQQNIPQNTRVVCFPRMPKPDTYPSEWIKDHWK